MFLPSRFKYEYKALSPSVNPQHEIDIINALASGFVEANVIQLRALEEAYPGSVPCCIECASVQYKSPESCFIERKNGKTVYDNGCQMITGAIPLLEKIGKDRSETCMGLATLHAALLIFHGDYRAKAIAHHTRDRSYHMVVVDGEGRLLDTSEIVKRPTRSCSNA